jgi:hypothetical protein
VHRGDRERMSDLLAKIRADPRPFTAEYRLVAADRATRHVAMVGTEVVDDGGGTTVCGSFLELASPATDVITAKVTEIVARRAAVEQTKGMLMLVYGMNEYDAFDVLRWLSQQNNVRLRPLARQIAADFVGSGAVTALRARFDRLLAAAPLRTNRAER